LKAHLERRGFGAQPKIVVVWTDEEWISNQRALILRQCLPFRKGLAGEGDIWTTAVVINIIPHSKSRALPIAPQDSRTLQSTPESGARAGYDGAKRRKGSKVYGAVDSLGHLLALHVTAADQQDRAQVERLAAEVQRITEDNIELAYVDQGYTGEGRRSGCTPARHPVGGGQACTGQARVRAAAAKMGGRT